RDRPAFTTAQAAEGHRTTRRCRTVRPAGEPQAGHTVMELDIKDIMERLPHRQPMLLVDRVREMDPSKSIVAIKNVTYNEPFFQGHFAHHPVMPGVLIIEALAQAAALFSFADAGAPNLASAKVAYYLVGVDGARFRRPVVPG